MKMERLRVTTKISADLRCLACCLPIFYLPVLKRNKIRNLVPSRAPIRGLVTTGLSI